MFVFVCVFACVYVKRARCRGIMTEEQTEGTIRFLRLFFSDTLNSLLCVFSLSYNISSLSLSLSLSLCLVVFILCLNSLLFFFVETRRRGGIAEVFIVFAERVGGDFTDVPRGERG